MALSTGTKKEKEKLDQVTDELYGAGYNPDPALASKYGNYTGAIENYNSIDFNPSKEATSAYDKFIADQANDPGDYKKGQSVIDAYNYRTAVEKAKPGEFTYDSSALQAVYDKIMNREDFSFDLGSSALYQQYRDQYAALGQNAMMDTMGQAAAMTGGYGSSYAVSAGQQAYQKELQNLNEIVPQLYGMALDQYQIEGKQLLDQYDVASSERANAYNIYRDAVSDWQYDYNMANQNYWNEQNFDFSTWESAKNFYFQQLGLDLDTYSTLYNQSWNEYLSELEKGANNVNWTWDDYTHASDTDIQLYEDYIKRLGEVAGIHQGNYNTGVGIDQFDENMNYTIDRDKEKDRQFWTQFLHTVEQDKINNGINEREISLREEDTRHDNKIDDKQIKIQQAELKLKQDDKDGSGSSTATTGDEEIDKILSGYNKVKPASSLSKKAQDTWANIYLTLTEGGKRNMDEPDIRNKLIKAINAAVGEKHMTKNEAMYLIVNLIGDKN